MTRKTFSFLGINRAMPQSVCPDGACQELINMRFIKGAWRPIGKKVHYKNLPASTYDKIWIHDIENGLIPGESNWIGYKKTEGKLYLINQNSGVGTEIARSATPGEDICVVFLKRTMIVTSSNGVETFLWTLSKAYVQTASLPVPDVDLSAVNIESKTTELTKVSTHKILAESTLGHYFELLNTESNQSGKMYGSIMYITAYRMFDGSYLLPSIPRYLKLSLGGSMVFSNWHDNGNYSATFTISMAGLSATINNELYPESIADTKDLIESVCIFATKATPLHQVNEDVITEAFMVANIPPNGGNSVHVTKQLKDLFAINSDFSKLAQSENWYKIHEFSFEDVVGKTGRTTVTIDTKGFYQDYATRETLATDQFSHHKLAARLAYVYNDRLHLANIKTLLGLPYVVWPDSDSNYGSLAADNRQGKLTVYLKTGLGQAVRQSNISIPVYREATQQRVTYASYSEAESFMAGLPTDPEYPNLLVGSEYIETIFTIEENRYVEQYSVTFKTLSGSSDYLFILPEIVGYNDYRAYRMQIAVWSGSEYVLLFDESLTKNEYMNFSFWHNKTFDKNDGNILANFPKTNKNVNQVSTPVLINNESELPYDTNRLQVSEIQNPLVFPTKNSYQIGTGDILQIASASTPLSAGQFGQFPLQVFTTKGIWALEVGTGDVLYANILPVNTEVINNAANVIPVKSGVIYTTDKGLFILSGMNSVQLSEVAEGDPFEAIVTIPEVEFMIDNIETNTHFTPGLDGLISVSDYLTYLLGSAIGYDPLNNELIVSNPAFGYSYIFNFESKMWTKYTTKYKLLINAYPALLGITDNDIVDITKESDDQCIEVLVITCAQSLDRPNIFKQIQRLEARCEISTEVGKYAGVYIFASDDLTTWQLITGRQRTGSKLKDFICQQSHVSAKYYVFVFNGSLNTKSSFNYFELDYKEKWTSKLQ